MNAALAKKIRTYIDERRTTKIEALHKERETKLKSAPDPVAYAEIESKYSLKEEELNSKFDVQTWLTDAASRAHQTTIVTHAVKFTHPSAKGSSLRALSSGEEQEYLSTDALPSCCVDAVGNAGALDVAKLLQLEIDGTTVASKLAAGDYSLFELLAENSAQAEEWGAGLAKALQSSSPASHTFAKQLYFPVADGEYHLVSPLYSSALSQQLYNTIHFFRDNDAAKEAREARKKKQQHDMRAVYFPNLAVMKHGGTKPQNVSQKNSERGGQSYLLSAAPPRWVSRTDSPIKNENFFASYGVYKATQHQIKALGAFLSSVFEKESNKRIRDCRGRMVDEIVDHVLSYAIQIQQQSPAGWSAESNLPRSHRLWLDPSNPDEKHQLAFVSVNWKQKVAADFAQWLNDKLLRLTKEKNMQFAKVEASVWERAFMQGLRDVSNTGEGDI